jgi:hypothetical protein
MSDLRDRVSNLEGQLAAIQEQMNELEKVFAELLHNQSEPAQQAHSELAPHALAQVFAALGSEVTPLN